MKVEILDSPCLHTGTSLRSAVGAGLRNTHATVRVYRGEESGETILRATRNVEYRDQSRGRHHGGRRPSNGDSLHSPTVISPSALDTPSILKRYHRRRTCSHTSPRRSPSMVTLHDTGFAQCRWWNDGWTVKTVVTCRSSAFMIPAPDVPMLGEAWSLLLMFMRTDVGLVFSCVCVTVTPFVNMWRKYIIPLAGIKKKKKCLPWLDQTAAGPREDR